MQFVLHLLFVWWTCASSASQVGKKRALRIAPPIFVSCVQLATSVALLTLLSWLSGRHDKQRCARSWRQHLRRLRLLLPASACAVLSHVCANVAVTHVPVTFGVTLKTASPVFSAAVAHMSRRFGLPAGKKAPGVPALLCLLPICFGAAISSISEMKHVDKQHEGEFLVGVLASLLSALTGVLRSVFLKSAMTRNQAHPLLGPVQQSPLKGAVQEIYVKGDQSPFLRSPASTSSSYLFVQTASRDDGSLTPTEANLYNCCGAALLLFGLFCVSNESLSLPDNTKDTSLPNYLFTLFLAGVASCASNDASVRVLARVTQVSFEVLRCCKRLLVILTASLLLHHPLSPRNWLGVVIACGGFLGYSLAARGDLHFDWNACKRYLSKLRFRRTFYHYERLPQQLPMY